MAHVNRDPRNGSWLARWRDPSGRSRSKSFRRKVDAERFLSQLVAEMHRGAYVDPAAGKVLMGDFGSGWADGLAHLKVSTATRYRGIVRTHISERWETWRLVSITHTDVSTGSQSCIGVVCLQEASARSIVCCPSSSTRR
jgi:hypothetical protein